MHCRFAPGHSRPGTQGALGDKQNIADAPGNLGNVAYEKGGYGAERVVAREACRLWEGEACARKRSWKQASS